MRAKLSNTLNFLAKAAAVTTVVVEAGKKVLSLLED